MKKNLTVVEFNGTKEQEEKLLAAIAKYKGIKGSTMPVLQEAQEIYGYLPFEVQKIIARELDISVEEIYGITTFYSQFMLNPKGQIRISVCLGTACYVKGSGAILDEIVKELGVEPGSTSTDGKYSVDSTRCVGACGLAPVMIVNDEVYGRLVPGDVSKIIAKYTA